MGLMLFKGKLTALSGDGSGYGDGHGYGYGYGYGDKNEWYLAGAEIIND